jgi:hypothetical protein
MAGGGLAWKKSLHPGTQITITMIANYTHGTVNNTKMKHQTAARKQKRSPLTDSNTP